MNPGDVLFIGLPVLVGVAYLSKRPSTSAAARDLVRCGHVMRFRRVLPCGPWPAGVHVVSLAE
jgi:hypothetical protein